MRVANKYFLADNLRVLLVGKGSEVIPGLEKTKIPIFYFDKFGNPTEKPAMKKPVPAGVTTKTVLDNYIKAIGGEKAVKTVKTISFTGTGTIPQAPAPLKLTVKKDNKNQSLSKIEMEGMGELNKQVINAKGGYTVQQGQRKDLTADELTEKRSNLAIFDELKLLTKTDLVLDGIEPINGSDAYAIKNGKSTLYYDVKSGLKVLDSKIVERGDKKMTVTTTYNDYRDVKGVKIPFEIIMNQGMELNFKMTEVKVNEGVTDKDFE
jgi:zinc protease